MRPDREFEIWLPDPPPLPSDRRRVWRVWAEGQRQVLAAIKKARLWTASFKCPTCELLGRRVPDDGCLDHHPYVDWTPNAWQPKVWYDQADVIAHTTGNGAGKSCNSGALGTFFGVHTPPLWFLEPERVDLLPLLPWHRMPGPHKIWLIGPKRENLEESIVRYVRQNLEGTGWVSEIGEYTAPGGKRLTSFIRLVTDTIIEARVQDQGKEAFMSADVDVIIEDEELNGPGGETCRSEAFGRLGRRLARFYFLCTAVDTADRGGDTWVAEKILEPGLSGAFCDDLDLKYSVGRSSTWENTHLPWAARVQHDALYRDPLTGEPGPWYPVRVEGFAVGTNVHRVLLESSIDWMLQHTAREPVEIGRLQDSSAWRHPGRWQEVPAWTQRPAGPLRVAFTPDEQGSLRIYAHPEEGREYTIGGDAASGVQWGGHASAAVVFDRYSGHVVATLQALEGPVEFGLTLARLGWYYNEAWINVARGGQGAASLDVLCGTDVGYSRYEKIYLYEPVGKMTKTAGAPGFTETAESKEAIIAAVNDALRPTVVGDPTSIPISIPDVRLLREMRRVRREKGRILYPEKQEGAHISHCDLFVGLAMALIAHRSPGCPMDYPPPETPQDAAPLTEVAARRVAEVVEREQRPPGRWVPLNRQESRGRGRRRRLR